MDKPKSTRVVKSGNIRKNDFLLIGGIWYDAIGSVGHKIGVYPWNTIGDVRRPLKLRKPRKTKRNGSHKLLLLGDVDHRVELRYGRKLSAMELVAVEVTFDIMSQQKLQSDRRELKKEVV